MIRRALLLLLLARLVAAAPTDQWGYRNATAGDDTELVRVRNAAAMPAIDMGTWTVSDATIYRTVTWTATQIITLNALLIGIMGSTDWLVPPGRGATLAPVAWPWIDPAVKGAQRADATRYLLRAVVNQLMGSTSSLGITPTALQVQWPVDIGVPQSALLQLGCTAGGQGTQGGQAVLLETICPLAALDAALRAAGVP